MLPEPIGTEQIDILVAYGDVDTLIGEWTDRINRHYFTRRISREECASLTVQVCEWKRRVQDTLVDAEDRILFA
jgi:hypothetical protein